MNPVVTFTMQGGKTFREAIPRGTERAARGIPSKVNSARTDILPTTLNICAAFFRWLGQ